MQKWVKVSDDPPPFNGWLCCPGCGHLSLESRGNILASVLGEPCMYCKTPIVRATAEDMKRSYPDGVYSLFEVEE